MTDTKKRIINRLETKRQSLVSNINDIKYRVIPTCLNEGKREEAQEWEVDLSSLQNELSDIESILMIKR